MTEQASEILKQALLLPAEERAQLADSLFESLDDRSEDPASVEAAWNDEIQRRIGELDSGSVTPVSLQEFRRRLASAAQ